MRQVTTQHHTTSADAAVRPNAPVEEAVEAAVEAPAITCEPVVYDGQAWALKVSNLSEEEAAVLQHTIHLGVSHEAAGIILVLGITQDPNFDSNIVVEVQVEDGDWCVVSPEWIAGHIDLFGEQLARDPLAILLLAVVNAE